VSQTTAVTAFIAERRRDLVSIAYYSRGEASVDDVLQTAWVAAHEIGLERGYPINEQDRDDQELLLKRLRREFGGRDRALRSAWRLGLGSNDEELSDKAAAIARQLSASPDADPLIRLVLDEESEKRRWLIAQSFSEASAYVLLLIRFGGNARALAVYLRVSFDCLRSSLGRAVEVMRMQPSLFDGLEVIDPEFSARRGKAVLPRARVFFDAEQACLKI
jgi:hypothetical protein